MGNDRYRWLTPSAPAAIALVEVPARAALLDRAPPATGRARRALLVDPEGRAVDDVVVTRLDAERLELSCHGGPGVREAVAACLDAHGLRPAAAATDDTWGRLSRAAAPAALRWIAARDDRPTPFPADFLYRQPRILIAGPVNAGKSTLMNAWCGYRRVRVDEEPGTTRDLVTAVTRHRGWRLLLIDSAGDRPGATGIERAGQDLAAAARAGADLVVHLDPVDAPAPGAPGDLVVRSKVDLGPETPAELPWAAPDRIGDAGAEAMLLAIGDAVLARLGLPGEGEGRC